MIWLDYADHSRNLYVAQHAARVWFVVVHKTICLKINQFLDFNCVELETVLFGVSLCGRIQLNRLWRLNIDFFVFNEKSMFSHTINSFSISLSLA